MPKPTFSCTHFASAHIFQLHEIFCSLRLQGASFRLFLRGHPKAIGLFYRFVRGVSVCMSKKEDYLHTFTSLADLLE